MYWTYLHTKTHAETLSCCLGSHTIVRILIPTLSFQYDINVFHQHTNVLLVVPRRLGDGALLVKAMKTELCPDSSLSVTRVQKKRQYEVPAAIPRST